MNHLEPRTFFILEAVHAVERTTDLAPDVGRDGRRNPSIGRAQSSKDARQRRPLHVLECKVQGPFVLTELERLHDVRMVNETEDSRLVGEHANKVFVTA